MSSGRKSQIDSKAHEGLLIDVPFTFDYMVAYLTEVAPALGSYTLSAEYTSMDYNETLKDFRAAKKILSTKKVAVEPRNTLSEKNSNQLTKDVPRNIFMLGKTRISGVDLLELVLEQSENPTDNLMIKDDSTGLSLSAADAHSILLAKNYLGTHVSQGGIIDTVDNLSAITGRRLIIPKKNDKPLTILRDDKDTLTIECSMESSLYGMDSNIVGTYQSKQKFKLSHKNIEALGVSQYKLQNVESKFIVSESGWVEFVKAALKDLQQLERSANPKDYYLILPFLKDNEFRQKFMLRFVTLPDEYQDKIKKFLQQSRLLKNIDLDFEAEVAKWQFYKDKIAEIKDENILKKLEELLFLKINNGSDSVENIDKCINVIDEFLKIEIIERDACLDKQIEDATILTQANYISYLKSKFKGKENKIYNKYKENIKTEAKLALAELLVKYREYLYIAEHLCMINPQDKFTDHNKFLLNQFAFLKEKINSLSLNFPGIEKDLDIDKIENDVHLYLYAAVKDLIEMKAEAAGSHSHINNIIQVCQQQAKYFMDPESRELAKEPLMFIRPGQDKAAIPSDFYRDDDVTEDGHFHFQGINALQQDATSKTILAEKDNANFAKLSLDNQRQAFSMAIDVLQKSIESKIDGRRKGQGGSTLCTTAAWVTPTSGDAKKILHLRTYSLGDSNSYVIVYKDGKPIADKCKRINSNLHDVRLSENGMMSLAVNRALGDEDFEHIDGFSHQGQFFNEDITLEAGESFVIVNTCDGFSEPIQKSARRKSKDLFEIKTQQEALMKKEVDLISQLVIANKDDADYKKLGISIIQKAYGMGSSDNISGVLAGGHEFKDSQVHLLTIADGHGYLGEKVSQYAAKKIDSVLQEQVVLIKAIENDQMSDARFIADFNDDMEDSLRQFGSTPKVLTMPTIPKDASRLTDAQKLNKSHEAVIKIVRAHANFVLGKYKARRYPLKLMSSGSVSYRFDKLNEWHIELTKVKNIAGLKNILNQMRIELVKLAPNIKAPGKSSHFPLAYLSAARKGSDSKASQPTNSSSIEAYKKILDVQKDKHLFGRFIYDTLYSFTQDPGLDLSKIDAVIMPESQVGDKRQSRSS